MMNVIVVVHYDDMDESWNVEAVLDCSAIQGRVRDAVDQLFGSDRQFVICDVQKVESVEVVKRSYTLIKH